MRLCLARSDRRPNAYSEFSNAMEKKELEYIPLYSLPNYKEKVVSLADWDAPYRSAQECPFVYGMFLKRVRVKRETESGENLLTAGGEPEDVGIEFEVNRTIEQGDAG